MDSVKIHDKVFSPYLSKIEIERKCEEIAFKISQEYQGKQAILIVVLNGAFLFAAEIFKRISCPMEVLFVRVSSYEGTKSTGKISHVSGIETIPEGKDLIIVEDIVDTGFTLSFLKKELTAKKPKSIKIASLLLKPDAYQGTDTIDYIGFSIPNEFVVGFGLDYNYLGRNLPEIYKL